MNVGALLKTTKGKIIAGAGGTVVAVGIGGPLLVLRLSHHAAAPVVLPDFVVEDDGLVDVDGHSVLHLAVLAEALHIPASGHFYIVPRGDAEHRIGKSLWPLVGISAPVELPSAVEAQVVLAAFGQDAARGTGIGKGEYVGTRLQLVERELVGALPLGAVGRLYLSVEKAVEDCFGTGTQGKCGKEKGCEEVFHKVN